MSNFFCYNEDGEIMDKYIIVKTLCDDEKIAKRIIDRVLELKLAAGCQIYECYSKYYWKKDIEISNEYLIEMRTKLSMFEKIKLEVLKIHNYDVCEISYAEIAGANEEFLNWIDENVN